MSRDRSLHEDVPPLTFGQLNTLMMLARWGKQAAAEAAVGKSQSQISRDLCALERALGGLVLIDRATRRPTEAGGLVLEYATETLGGWKRLMARLSGRAGEAGGATLVAEETCVAGAVLPALAQLRQRRPELGVRLLARRGDGVRDALVRGEADVGVTPTPCRGKGISARPWLQGNVVVAMPSSSSLSRGRAVDIRSLLGTAVLTGAEGSPVRGMVEKAADRKTLGRLVCQEVGPARDAALWGVAAGLGMALLVRFERAGDPLERSLPPGVTVRPLAGKSTTIEYGIVVRSRARPSGATLALVKELLRSVRDG